ncbi:hypothetical protein GCM10007881_52340 [Mesorhizobium huakuii]|nr:hypothetical protein GCM10007881_52340 [Mesorhizobium huakuii]
MNMPHGDRSCGRLSSIAPAGAAAAGALGGGVAGAVAGAGAKEAAGAGAAGACWAVALPADRMTDATNVASKLVLDNNSFFLVLTAASRFPIPPQRQSDRWA